MNKGRVKYRSDNHGLTLIELIVTIGIIGIFIGVVSTFLSTTSNTYRGTSNNSKVQMETQETFDKLEDVIINANRNLAYGTSSGQIGDDINGKDGACSTVSKIFMVSSGEDSDVVNLSEEDDDMPAVNSEDTVMTATAENGSSFGSESGENVADKAATSNSKADDETVRDYFIWDQSSGEVRYIHSEKVNGQWQNYNEDPNGDLLATGVMDFRADISKAVTDKIVRFQLRTKSGTKTIETLHSVSLRNDLGVSSQIDSPFVNPTGAPKPSVKPTDTPVPTEPPKPTGLTLNKSTVLLAAGTSLNMSNMKISGTVNYDDGTTSTAGNLSWTIDSNCTYATLNGGVIYIQENAGTASSGTVTLTATDTEHNNVSAQMTVYIARLDFSAPANNSSYTVGQDKPLQYTYMEGGQTPSDAGTVVNIQTVSKPDQAAEYSADGAFTQNDVGSWNVKATVNLSNRTGYDLVDVHIEKENQFSVANSSNDIIINQNPLIDTVVAGRTYGCKPNINWGFDWRPIQGYGTFGESEKIRWRLKENVKGVSLDNTKYAPLTVERKLTIASDVKCGFTICSDYLKKNSDGTEIQVHAEKEVKVANGINLVSLSGDTAYVHDNNASEESSDEYKMSISLNIYNSKGELTSVNIADGNYVEWKDLNTQIKFSNNSWIFYPKDYQANSDINIKAILHYMNPCYGIFDCNTTYNFSSEITVHVKKPENKKPVYTINVTAVDPDTNQPISSCKSNSRVKFIVHTYCDNVEINNGDVTWITWGKEFNVSENTAIYQIGSNVKEVQFQIKLMCGNQMKYAHIMFDEYGIRIINEW